LTKDHEDKEKEDASAVSERVEGGSPVGDKLATGENDVALELGNPIWTLPKKK
jgi:hypothetical protein